MKFIFFLKVSSLVIIISMMHITCMNNETTERNSDIETVQMGAKTEYTNNPNLIINYLAPRPQSIKPGESTQLVLTLDSKCPPTTPEEIHHKCHGICHHQKLEYTWTSSCPGSFNNANIDAPVFTPAPDLTSDSCELSVLLKNKCTMFSLSLPLSIIQENSKPIIDSITVDNSVVGQDQTINLNVEAHDPDGDELNYLWTSTCSGTFNNSTLQNPEFTVASDAPYGECLIFVEVDDGTDSVTEDVKIDIVNLINESPEILSSFQSANIIMAGEQILFIIRAKDPEGTALSFSWTSTAGTFTEPIESVNEEFNYTESIVQWTSPNCGDELIDVSVGISDSDGLVTNHTFLPITLIDGEPCQ